MRYFSLCTSFARNFSMRETRYFYNLTGRLIEVATVYLTDRTRSDAFISERIHDRNSSLAALPSLESQMRSAKVGVCTRTRALTTIFGNRWMRVAPAAAPYLVSSRICMVIANYQSSFVPGENRGSTSKLTQQQSEIITYYVPDNIRNQSRKLI